MPTPKFVVKRDGFKEIFNPKKIAVAINKAFTKGKVKADVKVVGDTVISYNGTEVDLKAMVAQIVDKLVDETVSIDNIQEKVVETLIENKFGPVASAYSNYMKHRESVRNQHNITKDDYLSKKMLVMKKSGIEEEFSIAKIESALSQGCEDVEGDDKLSVEEIKVIAEQVTRICAGLNRTIDTVEIRDIINKVLFDIKPALAKAMIEFGLKKNSATGNLISRCKNILDMKNEEIKQENSNKNPVILSTQRDYLAGEVSKSIMDEVTSPEVLDAHNAGIIHMHDRDYTGFRQFNCALLNLEDMFQNGTVINGTKIDPPTSFQTAANLASQISLAVGSNQYGGQTITLTHLAPFVEKSRQKKYRQIKESLDACNIQYTEEQLKEFVEKRVRAEIVDGVQTIQYQYLTLSTGNGQSPFISVAMYLNETKDEKLRADLALIIEEMFKQRIKGIKNRQGIWVTPAFPKLLYFIDENNCDETKPYWYLTELAARCTAKRMVPDYISEKIMLRDKIDKLGNGNVYPCMGELLKTTAHVKLEERMTKRCELIAC